ncbi:MAG: hypothetical protein WAT12_11585 [Candidatus Nitrotoga sp.]
MKWITALNLNQWAEKIDARAVFPGLIGDLIRASATDINSFRFPSGDKSQVRGFDGRLSSSGAPPYVPSGDSIWEFGCSGATVAKANGDYQKRTEEVSEEVRSNTALVIASPYTWDAPRQKLDEWLREKRELNNWKQVEYLDGVVIESWLDLHPAVAARYARYELDLLPQLGVLSTEEFWVEYSTRFHPQLSEDVLLCDRQPQTDKLLKALAGSQGVEKFAADSPDEVIAFAVAALRKAEPATRLFLEARTVIVETQDAARLMSAKKGLAFLPKGQARESAGMLARSGAVIVGIGRDEPKDNYEVLNRTSSSSMGKAIATMGFTEDEGYQLARKCGRSVTILARLIKSGSVKSPEWIEHGKKLLPALLAGSWSDASELDTNVLCGLGGVEKYEKLEAHLRPLTRLTDPPIDRIEDVWKMRAPVDAFVYIGHLIGSDDLGRLKVAATTVFGKIEDPPNPDELFRLDRRNPTQHSDWLRDGLATTLLQIAVLHSQADLCVSGSTPQDYVNDIIRSLPGLSTNHRLLSSLRDQLPLLAEAAPNPFMEALEQLLEGEIDLLKPIFSEQEHFLSPSSPHTGLLWALEVLAWDPALLPRVALILARLAAIDPGGRLANRPINSLSSIFLSWAPNTNATLKQRLGALDYVILNVPAIGWELLITLLPKPYGISSPSAKPKFREAASEVENLTYGTVWESQRNIVNRALVQADDIADRLITIIESMRSFEPAGQIKALEIIEKYLIKHAQSDREAVWAALRDEANKNKTFSSADWTIKNDELARIDQIVERYQPSDPITLNVWLFDSWSPDVPGKLDHLGESLNDVRKMAISTILTQLGVDGVQILAEKAKLPQFVAASLEYFEIDITNYGELVKNSLEQGGKLEHFAAVVSAVAYKKFSCQWITLIKEMAASSHWPHSTIVRLLVALPDERRTWEIAAEFGPGMEVDYWGTKHSHYFTGNKDDIAFVANKYLGVGRPVAAIEALHDKTSDVPTPLLLELLDSAITEINRRNEAGNSMFAYYVEKIFEVLEVRNDGDAEQIAQREYAYLPIFDRREKPLMLHRLLMENPELYVSVIKDVFRPASGEKSAPSEESSARASASYRLLGSIKLLPGQNGKDINFNALRKWCIEVQKRAVDIDRAVIADQYIGHILAHAPADATDMAWPHSAVRRLLEDLCSDEVERGLVIERHNMRGVYSKSLDEGGTQERALAEQARKWANAMPSFPRAVTLLTRIADNWDREAEQEDIRMEQERLKW